MQLKKLNERKSLASVCNCYAAIQERVYTNDGQGGQIETWQDVSGYEQIPMSIWPMTELKIAELRSFNVYVTHWIKIRSNITVDEKNNRILYGTRLFKIQSVSDIQERGVEQLIMAKEDR